MNHLVPDLALIKSRSEKKPEQVIKIFWKQPVNESQEKKQAYKHIKKTFFSLKFPDSDFEIIAGIFFPLQGIPGGDPFYGINNNLFFYCITRR